MNQKSKQTEKQLLLFNTPDMLGRQYIAYIQTNGIIIRDVREILDLKVILNHEFIFAKGSLIQWKLSQSKPECLSGIVIGSSIFYGSPQTLEMMREQLSISFRFTNFKELYEKEQTISTTLYGEVFQSTNKISKLISATKIINKKKLWAEFKIDSQLECQKIADGLITQEVDILRTLKHPLIVDLLEVFEDEQSYYLVFENLAGGCLEDLFERSKLPSYQVKILLKKILEAVIFIHQNEIAHRDLKPRNIMFAKKNDITSVKLIDFGLAVYANTSNFTVIQCGTPGYTAPEIFKLKRGQKRYDKVCDMFSVGAIFYKMLRNEELFDATTRQEVSRLNQICNLKNLKGIKYGNHDPDLAEDLILKMLQTDPQQRISADQALKHQFIQGKFMKIKNPIEEQDSYQSNGRSTMYDLSFKQNVSSDHDEYKTDEELFEQMEYLIEDECVKVNQIFFSQKHL